MPVAEKRFADAEAIRTCLETPELCIPFSSKIFVLFAYFNGAPAFAAPMLFFGDSVFDSLKRGPVFNFDVNACALHASSNLAPQIMQKAAPSPPYFFIRSASFGCAMLKPFSPSQSKPITW